MKRLYTTVLALALVLAWGVGAAYAQGAQAAAPAPAPAPTGPSKVNDEAWAVIEDAGTKLGRLAQAIPQEKYTWRPVEGVRSVSELFLHVAAGNFNIPRRVGTQPPADFKPQGFDTSTTDKAKVIETLKASFEHLKAAAGKVSDADMEKTAAWFGGRQASYREILFFLAAHDHEHLGQAIAYTRMLGITPPWTEEQQQRQRQPAENQ